MPPLSQLRTPSLQSLYEQLRFAPKAALLRDIERAESLASEIDIDQAYPADWIVFRVTGYRPEMDEPALVPGADLLGDLSALVEHLSHGAAMRWTDLDDGSFLDTQSLCERWGVSRKTVDRFRKRGLIARRVESSEGQSILMFSAAAVESFEASPNAPVARASNFTRISDDEAQQIRRRARRYHTTLNLSLNETAKRLAARFSRSHEGVRQLLLRLDRTAPPPIFRPRPPAMDRRKALVLRASRLGIEPATIADRLGVSRDSITRTHVEARADILRSFTLAEPTDDVTDATPESLIDSPPLNEAIEHDPTNPHDTDLALLVAHARTLAPPKAADESRLALERLATERAAARILHQLPSANVSATLVDQAETLLRRESRLREQLVRMQLGSVIRTIEDSLAVQVDHVVASELTQLLALSIAAAAEAAGRFDPSKGSRLAAPVGLAVSRVVTAWDRSGARTAHGGRALPLLRQGHAIDDWTRRVSPWQTHLEPDPRVRRFLNTLPEPLRSILALRYGFSCTPMTTAQIAAALNLAPTRINPLVRQAIRAALDASRQT
jgi:hypothetical protein